MGVGFCKEIKNPTHIQYLYFGMHFGYIPIKRINFERTVERSLIS